MFKILVLICLIIQTHSWTWDVYPSPRGTTYWKCGVSKPTWVCDPDGMLTEQQREEIVQLVEDFKEKTKRPKSRYRCMREGLRLVVALARDKIDIDDAFNDPRKTGLCENGGWVTSDRTTCESDVHGVELNEDGFRYCYKLRWLGHLHTEDLEQINNAWIHLLKTKNYFYALKNYIESLRMLYIHRFSIFDDNDISLEDTKESLAEIRLSDGQQNKTLSRFSADIEGNKLKLLELQQSLDQQNKTLVETNQKLSEMRALLLHGQMLIGKNTTTPLDEEEEK
uniref:Uncharacterized protein n=1 Tax=Meloidogyne enterolobii TaxID=390850 RepID=A0A6V7UZW4_MELEN|nr:unnamed protein product [Meloidogyne enterolobii]